MQEQHSIERGYEPRGWCDIGCDIVSTLEVNRTYRRITPVLKRDVFMLCDRILGDLHVHMGVVWSSYPNPIEHRH